MTTKVSVEDLVRSPALQLRVLAGRAGLSRSVSWAHVSELDDPTPWLLGAEVIMTTGIGVPRGAAEQRAYLERLDDAGVSALALSAQLHVPPLHPEFVAAAEERGMPLLEVPLAVPFIAIAQEVAAAVQEDARQRLGAQLQVFGALRWLAAEDLDSATLVRRLERLSGYDVYACTPQGRPLLDGVPVPDLAVTVGLEGRQLAELGAMADSAARVRVFSDDGHCVDDAVLMRRALEYVKAFDGVVAQHAQEPRLTSGAQMNEGVISGRLGLAGWPAVAEEAIIARDCLLAAHVGSRLHICHVSTAGSVEILRWAKSKGWNVTAEVTPHHLLLTDELVEESPNGSYNPIYKVNPPLRTRADVEALRAALADGTIDVVATDHAPHPVEDKETEWAAAAMGMIGLETALSVVQEAMVDTGLLDWAGVAERMSLKPAEIGRLSGHGNPIEAGAPANITLYDPGARTEVDPRAFASKSRNTPYEGMTLPGRVVATFLRGKPTVLEGKLV
ncbi:dihydroorotase [Nonomuraea sp. NPDC055795]